MPPEGFSQTGSFNKKNRKEKKNSDITKAISVFWERVIIMIL